VESFDKLKKITSDYLNEFNTIKKSELNLILFTEAILYITKIVRILMLK